MIFSNVNHSVQNRIRDLKWVPLEPPGHEDSKPVSETFLRTMSFNETAMQTTSGTFLQFWTGGGGGAAVRHIWDQRPCITIRWTHAFHCLGWLDVCLKSGGGGSCKGCAVPPAYTQSCPAVIQGVLQLWKRRITK